MAGICGAGAIAGIVGGGVINLTPTAERAGSVCVVFGTATMKMFGLLCATIIVLLRRGCPLCWRFGDRMSGHRAVFLFVFDSFQRQLC